MSEEQSEYQAEEQASGRGRPTIYTDELAKEICDRIAEGESLKAICLSNGMPSRSIIYDWKRDNPIFSDMYAQAKRDQADSLADEIHYIADTEPDPAKARVRVDARKWTASKLRPGSYGERAQVDLNLKRDVTDIDDAELAAIAAGSGSGTSET